MDIHYRIVRTSLGFAIQVKMYDLYWDTIERYYSYRTDCYTNFLFEMSVERKGVNLIEHNEVFK